MTFFCSVSSAERTESEMARFLLGFFLTSIFSARFQKKAGFKRSFNVFKVQSDSETEINLPCHIKYTNANSSSIRKPALNLFSLPFYV